MEPEEDGGWRVSWRMLRFLVPGSLQMDYRRGRAKGVDGLAMLRDVWTSFVGAIVLFGIVILFVIPGSRPSGALPHVVLLAVATVACLSAETWALHKSLDCTSPTGLANSFRARFFLAIAFSEAIALLAFVATFISGRWWIYWAFAPFAVLGFTRNAPTHGHLEAEQWRLNDQGCTLSLVRSLRQQPRP